MAASRDWMLSGGSVAVDAVRCRPLDLAVSNGRIRLNGGVERVQKISAAGCLILPGLINTHDHLEFSLFPRLGPGPFANARLWAETIYRPEESPVLEQLQIPKTQRLVWGGLRNLLSGVTTVSQHNLYQHEVFDDDFPIRVVKNYGWAHSLNYSQDVTQRFALTPASAPFLIHLAEGTDESARREIFELDRLGGLASRTVLVHGVGLDDAGLDLIEQRRAALIWCPSSNLFTLGATLGAEVFKRPIPIALATDSPLTAQGDLLDELALGCRLGGVDRARLYDMVTVEAARVLRLEQGEGRLAEGGTADLLVVRDNGRTPAETLVGAACEPLLVMLAGEIKLVAESFAGRLPDSETGHLRRIHVEGRAPCLAAADVPGLLASARLGLGADATVRLGGRAVIE